MALRRSCSALVLALSIAAASDGADDWLQLQTPHFTLMSEASESRTRDWATEFELFRRAMMVVMPVNPAVVEPVTLVLFRSDRRLRSFKPLENGKPSNVAGYFARAPGRNLIATSVEGARDDVREIIYHEAVHWHLAASERARPLWLEEGLAQVFGKIRFEQNGFVIGALRPESMRHVAVARPLPFARMMEVGAGGLSYNGKHGDVAQLFYHQAWVMLHDVLFGADGVGVVVLIDYLNTPAQERDPVRDFERGFGLSAARMDQRLAAYLDAGRFRSLTLPLNRTGVQDGFKLKPVPPPETDLTLGNLLIGAGRAAEAEPFLSRALQAMPSEPRVWEALAGMHLEREKMDDAIAAFRQALSLGSRSFIAHFVLGQHALRRAAQPDVGPQEASEAVSHFMQAVQINPRFVPAYEALALGATMLPARSAEAEKWVEFAAARYPTNVKLQTGLVFIALKYGETAKAQAAVEKGQRILGLTPPPPETTATPTGAAASPIPAQNLQIEAAPR